MGAHGGGAAAGIGLERGHADPEACARVDSRERLLSGRMRRRPRLLGHALAALLLGSLLPIGDAFRAWLAGYVTPGAARAIVSGAAYLPAMAPPFPSTVTAEPRAFSWPHRHRHGEPYHALVPRPAPRMVVTVTGLATHPTNGRFVSDEGALALTVGQRIDLLASGSEATEPVVLDFHTGEMERPVDPRLLPHARLSLRPLGTLPMAPWATCRDPVWATIVPCGVWAEEAIRRAFRVSLDEVAKAPESRSLRCMLHGHAPSGEGSPFDRPVVGRCQVIDHARNMVLWDIAERLVAHGVLRVAYPDDLSLLQAEQEAIRERRGLWAFRHAFPQVASTASRRTAYDARAAFDSKFVSASGEAR